ncbi:MAG: mannonate dehydratase [Chitinophagaceae bacterium]|nr:MAG: mannonate dehydratase [Chitinophagaceae bacterium]
MHETMRWFGPGDPVSLQDLRQAGCAGVVTALHQVPVGHVWTIQDIQARKDLAEAAGLTWTVVESLPVSDDIKRWKDDCELHVRNYMESLHNLGACGIRVVTYNFMPVFDWLRTDTGYALPGGSLALRFERVAFIAFDLFMLRRPGAEKDYSKREIRLAEEWMQNHATAEQAVVFKSVLLGLPGSTGQFTPEKVLAELDAYGDIDRLTLQENLFRFLTRIIPAAEEAGIRMAIHPDDPPYAVFGLPRVVSTESDLQQIIDSVPSASNGFCYCTGSLGVRADNDLPGIIDRLGDHIHFLHLRNTTKDTEGNFFEAGHLDGDADMVTIVDRLLQLMARRKVDLHVRPDHGHQMLDDLHKTTYPGYSAIGRLKGLAELRGLQHGLAAKFV